MRFTTVLFTSLLVLCTTLPVTAPAAGRMSFPDAGLSIAPPAGFERAASFHGLQQASSGASIVLASLPGPYAEVTRGFTREGLAQRGMQVRTLEQLRVDGRSALLLLVSQTAHGQPFLKWMLAFGDERVTRLVTANFPASTAPTLSDPLRSAVLSASTRLGADTAAASPSFSITPAEGLEPVPAVRSIGRMQAFTRDGQLPLSSPKEALFILAPSLGEVVVGDREQFAVRRLQATAGVLVESVNHTAITEVDGLQGVELVAAGRDRNTDTPLALYQLALFPPEGGYVLMTGMTGRETAAEMLLKFREMGRSFRRGG